MRNKFKKIDGTIIDNISEYIYDYIDLQRGEFKLFVGTDAQRLKHKNTIMYATVICIYKVGKGAHVVYRKTKRNNIKDLFNKLWWEVEDSLQIANELKHSGLFLHTDILSIHLDLSPNKKDGSNMLYNSAVGYIKSFGYDVKTKPDSPVASHIADWCVRR